MTEPFTPPSMLDMPFASLNARRAAQEDAYMAYCEARDAAAHEERTTRRIALNLSFSSGTPAGEEAGRSPVPASSNFMPGVDRFLQNLITGKAA
jgi:hypothetical protein